MGFGGGHARQVRCPARPGDELSLRSIVAEQRRSRSRPEMGVVSIRSELVNHERDLVFSMASASLIMCRPDGA
jgi:acyl dehydratase